MNPNLNPQGKVVLILLSRSEDGFLISILFYYYFYYLSSSLFHLFYIYYYYYYYWRYEKLSQGIRLLRMNPNFLLHWRYLTLRGFSRVMAISQLLHTAKRPTLSLADELFQAVLPPAHSQWCQTSPKHLVCQKDYYFLTLKSFTRKQIFPYIC